MRAQYESLDPREILERGSSQLGISLEPKAVSHMLGHLRLLQRWGKKFNLTSITGEMEAVIYHFLDSLVPLKVIPEKSGLRILDIGSGAGFPGLVIRAARPTTDITLVDANPKKIVFMKHVVHDLGFSGITFLNMTVQRMLRRIDQPGHDLVISRAFSSDSQLMDSFAKLLDRSGFLIRMTGPADRDTPFLLPSFHEQSFWEGILPFSESYRRVTLYRKNHE